MNNNLETVLELISAKAKILAVTNKNLSSAEIRKELGYLYDMISRAMDQARDDR